MDKIVDKYNNIYKESLEYNKKYLIEAFVKYYGEKYRDYITKSFEEINYCWGIHPFLLYDIKYNRLSKNIDDPKYLDDVKYICSLRDNRIIGSNNSNYLILKSAITNVLNEKISLLSGAFDALINDNTIKVVYFSMFMNDDKDIIHEINHYLCTKSLAILEDSLNKQRIQINKSGLSSFGDEKRFFEELINERTSIDITDIFHKLGGSIVQKIPPVTDVNNDYEKFLPLIESFYLKYLSIIKEVKISENGNELYRYVNKDIYQKYVDYINYIVKTVGLDHNKLLDGKYINICNVAVLNMDNNDKRLI